MKVTPSTTLQSFTSRQLSEPGGASARIFDYGAHLTSWKTSKGKEWMFMSKKAKFEHGVAIRGGVPIIFPQFNAFGTGPRHGFARNMFWKPLSTAANTNCTSEVSFELTESEETLAVWPYPFQAIFHVKLDGDQVVMTLRVENTGTEKFEFTCALHTYFAVNDLFSVQLKGLKNLSYWDNNGSDFSTRQSESSEVLSFTGAIDRVYFGSSTPLTLSDGADRLRIACGGFSDVVVWTPGEEAAKKMADLDDSEYTKMLCIEAAAIDNSITIMPGQSWQGFQSLTSL